MSIFAKGTHCPTPRPVRKKLESLNKNPPIIIIKTCSTTAKSCSSRALFPRLPPHFPSRGPFSPFQNFRLFTNFCLLPRSPCLRLLHRKALAGRFSTHSSLWPWPLPCHFLLVQLPPFPAILPSLSQFPDFSSALIQLLT